MTNRLASRIAEDIEKTGFPLELRVAALLRDEGHPVANNVFFLDRDEGKGREVDLRALVNAFFRKGRARYVVRHCLVVECKKSAARPWVVFTSPAVSYDQDVTAIHCRGAKGDAFWAVPRDFDELAVWTSLNPWFAARERGRSFYEAFSGVQEANQSMTKALLGTVKARIDVRDSGFGTRSSHRGDLASIVFYYPLVVLEGELFAARLSHGRLIVHAVPCVPVSINYRSPHYPEDQDFTVMVTKEQFLPALLRRLSTWQDFCVAYLKGHTSGFKKWKPEGRGAPSNNRMQLTRSARGKRGSRRPRS